MLDILKENKEVLLTIAFLAFLVLIYPSIFSHIYQSGRDFGSSIVRALLP